MSMKLDLQKTKRSIKRIIDRDIPFETILSTPVDEQFLRYLFVSGVYILYERDEILYIGASEYIGNRISSHLKNGEKNLFGYRITHAKVIRFKESDDIFDIESALIARLCPKFNKTINPEFPMAFRNSKKRNRHLHELANLLTENLKSIPKIEKTPPTDSLDSPERQISRLYASQAEPPINWPLK